jgi:hypothetical protein
MENAHTKIRIDRVWSMPSRWTFKIKPIHDFVYEYVGRGFIWVDPFAGFNSPAQITNDLNPESPAKFHLDAMEFLKSLPEKSADGVLFDPPYSPLQIMECYKGFGVEKYNTKMNFWSDCKNEIDRIVKPGGYVLCFGWNTMGMGKNRGYEMEHILLVPHGGSRNDTICTAEKKKERLL